MSDPNRKAEKAALAQRAADQYAEHLRTAPEFVEFPKISRLNRDITITEKIDGTNAAIHIDEAGQVFAQSRKRHITPEQDNVGFARWVAENADALRSVLGPGLHFGEWWGRGIQRNYGLQGRRFSLFNFTRWANDPSVGALASIGVQVVPIIYHGPWIAVVGGSHVEDTYPRVDADGKLHQGVLRYAPDLAIDILKRRGSFAQPGYKGELVDLFCHPADEVADMIAAGEVAGTYRNGQLYKRDTGPEGIVVFHEAGRALFKVTIENDEQHKFEKSDSLLIDGVPTQEDIDNAMLDDQINPEA